MRLMSRIAFALLATAALIAGGPASAQQKLKWAHVYETSEPYHTESVWAAAEIKKRTNGKFDIEVFPASSLGKETDINQGMALGTVDMIISGPSFAARSYPRLGIAYYPFIFRDADHLLAYSKSAVFGEMVNEFRAKTGIQILAYTYYGARQTTSNRPFTDCAGMKGLKIRVPDVPAYMATPKSCGANPTPIAFAEVYLALQNGTVEAQENPLTTIEAKKFYEVQKAIMMTSHIVDGLTTQVAPHVWNKLTDAEKKIFTDVTREAAARQAGELEAHPLGAVDREAVAETFGDRRMRRRKAGVENAPGDLEVVGFGDAHSGSEAVGDQQTRRVFDRDQDSAGLDEATHVLDGRVVVIGGAVARGQLPVALGHARDAVAWRQRDGLA